MADLLKRLQTSQRTHGVGLEDNDFAEKTEYECMNFCFGGGGSPPPPPPATVTQQTSNIPEYFQPYLERLFERGEAVTTEPFERYEGQRLADVTPQQQAAYQGVESLVGGYKPYIATADLLTTQAAQQSTDPTAIAARMSPYQQSVIDIQKREALRDANKLQQQIGASAVGAGAFGGSRQALQETELARQTGQRLADIQAVGSQQAYQQAMNQLAADRAASLAAGQQFAGLGAQQQQLGLAGLGALETVGGTQQAQQQRALDIAYEDFARERTFPSQQVQEMSSILRGFNLPVSTYTTAQTQQAPPTFGQQAAGLGLGALGIYGAGKGVGLFAEGGDVPDNPGIKKLAAKAPQVVEKMGFDPQEVINAYVGGKINFQEGGDTDDRYSSISNFLEKYGTPASIAVGAAPFIYGAGRKIAAPFKLAKDQLSLQKQLQGKSGAEQRKILDEIIKKRREKTSGLSDEPIVFGKSAKDIAQSISQKSKDILSSIRKSGQKQQVDETVEALKPKPREGDPINLPQSNLPVPVTGRGPVGMTPIQAAARFDPTKNLLADTTPDTSPVESTNTQTATTSESLTNTGDGSGDNIIATEQSSLDKLKELLSREREDTSGIAQATAGLQALVEGENIRTGRVPVGEMGTRIAEVGKSFAEIEKSKDDALKTEIQNLATVAGLEINEAKQLADEEYRQIKQRFDEYKLGLDTQVSIIKALGGDVGVTSLLQTEDGRKKFREILSDVIGQVAGQTTDTGKVVGKSPTNAPLREIDTRG